MTKQQLLKLTTFAAICKAEGKNESDYDVAKGSDAAEKAAICLRRVRLICKPFNGNKKPDIANTDQRKYYPFVQIIPDSESPFGFRLSYLDYDCVNDCSCLGARPYLLDRDHVRIVFEQFRYEYEQWIYWDNKANQE